MAGSSVEEITRPGALGGEATEGLAPAVGPERLKRGVLGLTGIVASTMANIGPAMSFYFGFALIAGACGVAAPLAIIAAAVGVAFVGNTVAEFSRWLPSTGSWVTYIGKGLGPVWGTAFAVTFLLALAPGAASLLAIQGGWASTMIQQYAHVHIPWQILCVVLAVVLLVVVLRGIGISTKVAGVMFVFEMVILVGVSIAVLIVHRGNLSLAPFEPSHLSGGLKGLGLAFPLATYMFIGWENSAGLAEETHQPRRNVPRAIMMSIAVMVAAFVLFSYATVVGFDYNAKDMAGSAVPFMDAARGVMGGAIFFAYLAGMTSILGCVVAAVNSQARILFSAGREGILPRSFGRLTTNTRTPVIAFAFYFGFGLAIALIWGHNLDPVTFYAEAATLFTVPLILAYGAVNLALMIYAWREHRDEWSLVRHLFLPLLGIAAVGYPLYELVLPGQPSPYNLFGFVTLGFVVVGLVYALVRRRREPHFGERLGSVVADA